MSLIKVWSPGPRLLQFENMASGSNSAHLKAVEQLCPACGLCCNGVLFGNVELQKGDDPKRLASLGLKLERYSPAKAGTTNKTSSANKGFRFSQPCSCFDGRLCCIYADRPARCRSFDCALLKAVQNRKRTAAEALRLIEQARRQVSVVINLLQRLGQTDATLPLSRRCAKIISQPIDLAAGEEEIEVRAELMLAIHNLTQMLQRNFL